MTKILERLEQLDALFRETNAPILQYLNPGLSEEEIINFFESNKIPIHPALISLYKWHNGVKSIYGHRNGLTEIIPLGAFPNLLEMLALRNDFLSYTYFDVENRHEYVPFLSGGEDDMHLLRTSDGQIYHSSPCIQVYCDFAYDSLSSLLELALMCYQRHLLIMGPAEGLLVDDAYWHMDESL